MNGSSDEVGRGKLVKGVLVSRTPRRQLEVSPTGVLWEAVWCSPSGWGGWRDTGHVSPIPIPTEGGCHGRKVLWAAPPLPCALSELSSTQREAWSQGMEG